MVRIRQGLCAEILEKVYNGKATELNNSESFRTRFVVL